MKYIVDMSKFQKSSNINWGIFSTYIDFLILRVQFGSSSPDSQYQYHVANAKQYNVPFHTYAFPAFVNVNDARVESGDAFHRQDSDSLSIAIDIEPSYDSNGNPTAITKLSKSERIDGLKAYVDELRKLGQKKIGAYVANHIYKSWGIDEIVDIFDYIWIPKYTTSEPDYPCDLWQYTSSGRIPGYNGNLDISRLNGNKNLDWFLGKEQQPNPTQPVQDSYEIPKSTQPSKEMDYMAQFNEMFDQALEDLRKKPVSTWAEDEWKEACANGYFDGTGAQGLITRQEDAAVINRLRHNIKGLFADMDKRIKALEEKVK